jgi:hypothetical protein
VWEREGHRPRRVSFAGSVLVCWEKRGGDDGKKAMATMTMMMIHHGVVIAVAGLFLRARRPSNLMESTRETARGALHCDDRAGGSGDTRAKETRFSVSLLPNWQELGKGKRSKTETSGGQVSGVKIVGAGDT